MNAMRARARRTPTAMPAVAPGERPAFPEEDDDDDDEAAESESESEEEPVAAAPATSVAADSCNVAVLDGEEVWAVSVFEAAAAAAAGPEEDIDAAEPAEAVAAAPPLESACVAARAYSDATTPLVLWTVKSGPTTKLATLSESCSRNEHSMG